MKKFFFLMLGLAVAANAFAVTPADPTDVRWYDCGNETGYSYLAFTLPTVDVNGNPLDIEMMGYRIYTDDDQLFTFNSAQYDNVWGSTTDLYYYNWEAGTDIQDNIVYFYHTNAEGFERFFNTRIGIQVFYLNDNFTIGGTSNIVYYELPQEEGMKGDVDGDKAVSVSDVTTLIDYLLSGSIEINEANADVDGNGVAISDVTAIIDYLLSGTWN